MGSKPLLRTRGPGLKDSGFAWLSFAMKAKLYCLTGRKQGEKRSIGTELRYTMFSSLSFDLKPGNPGHNASEAFKVNSSNCAKNLTTSKFGLLRALGPSARELGIPKPPNPELEWLMKSSWTSRFHFLWQIVLLPTQKPTGFCETSFAAFFDCSRREVGGAGAGELGSP